MTQFEGLTQLLTNPPLLTSKQANWNNFFLAYYQHSASECKHTIEHHVLEVIEPNSRSHHERRMGRKHLSSEIRGGEAFLCPAHTNHWVSWEESLNFTVLVFDASFLKQLADEMASFGQIELAPQWNIFDPVIQSIVKALKTDLEAGSPAGRLYGESFGTALSVHLLKNSSTFRQKYSEYLGGLSQQKLKRVLDIVLSVLVLSARGSTIKALLWACIAVDATDVLSAQISGASSLFNASNTWSLTLTAVAALVPEIAALALIYRRQLPEIT